MSLTSATPLLTYQRMIEEDQEYELPPGPCEDRALDGALPVQKEKGIGDPYWETYRLTESPVLTSYMQEILDELIAVSPEYSGPAEVKLVDGHGFAQADHPNCLMRIDKRLLGMLETKDELAWLIGHELGHIVFREERKPHELAPSVIEETFADDFGQRTAVLAGYSREGGAGVLEKLLELDKANPEDGYSRWFYIVYHDDPHLSLPTRIVSLASDFEGARGLAAGEEHLDDIREPVPIPPWFKEELSHVSHESLMSLQKKEAGYDTLSIPGKVRFLKDFLESLSNMGRKEDYEHELDELSKHYGQLKSDRKFTRKEQREINEAVDELVDLCVNKVLARYKPSPTSPDDAAVNFVWKQILHSTTCAGHLLSGGRDDYKGVFRATGPFRKLKNAVISFRRARTLEEAQEAAEDYLRRYSLISPIAMEVHHDQWRDIRLPARVASNPLSDDDLLTSWLRQDRSRVIFRFLHEANAFRGNEEMLDVLPVEDVRAIRDEDDNEFFIDYYLEQREGYGQIKLPPDLSLLQSDPRKFAEVYSPVLNHPHNSTWGNYDRFHPFFGRTDEEISAVYYECSRVYCEELDRRINSDDPAVRREAKRMVLGLPVTWKSSIFGGAFSNVPSFSSHRWYIDVSDPEKCPYLQFMKKNASRFSLKERIFVAGRIFHDNLCLDDSESVRLELWPEYGSFPLPASFKEFRQFLSRTGTPRRKGRMGVYVFKEPDEPENKAALLSPRPLQAWSVFFAAIRSYPGRMIQELPYQILSSVVTDGTELSEKERLELIRTIPSLPPVPENQQSNYAHILTNALVSRYRETGDPGDTVVHGLTAEEAICAYLVFLDLNVFEDYDSRAAWGDYIVQLIEKELLPERRFDLYTKTLAHSHGLDIDTRRKFTAGLAEADAEYLGIDDGSVEYRERVGAVMESRAAIMGAGAFYDMIEASSRAVQAQRELAFFMRDLGKPAPQLYAVLNIPALAAEALLRDIGRDPQKVRSFLDFMTSTAETHRLDEFRSCIHEWEGNDGDWFFWAGAHESGEREPNTAAKGGESRKLRERMVLRDLHTSFWEADLATRTVILKQAIISPERFIEDAEGAVGEAVEIVLDHLFPADEFEAGTAEARSSEWARELVRTLIECSHETEQGLLITALVAASQKIESEGHQLRTGQRLKAILSALGPAYIKLGQAIHSWERTPADIKEDLADLKGMTAEPDRATLHEMIDDVVPEETRTLIGHAGDIVGAASFNITVLYETVDGQKEALSMVRRHALAQGLKGFDTLSEVTDKLADRHDEFRPYRQDALNIIAKSRQMTFIETDTAIGARQAEVQRELYDGAEIRTAGNTFTFHAAKWLEHGDGYRRMEAANGALFDLLPENTAEEKAFKDEAAAAILTMELRNILRGGRFDCDRHERQYMIDGSTIWVFDPGGISVNEPSREDKESFAVRLAEVAQSGEEDVDVLEAVRHGLSSASSTSDYLSHVQRALFSLSYAIGRLAKEDLASLLISVLSEGDVDPVIKNTFFREVTRGNPVLAAIGFDRLIGRFRKGEPVVQIVRLPGAMSAT